MVGGLIAFGLLGIFLGPVLLAIGFSLVKEWCVPEGESSHLSMREFERSEDAELTARSRAHPPA